MEQHRLNALAYATRPIPAEIIDLEIASAVNCPTALAIRNIANVKQFPDVIVPTDVTRGRLPISISLLGMAYSEPKLLA